MHGLGHFVLAYLPFSKQGLYILCLLLQMGGGEEVAVFTTTLAKRNMYVYTSHYLLSSLLQRSHDTIRQWLDYIHILDGVSIGHGCYAPSVGWTPYDDTA